MIKFIVSEEKLCEKIKLFVLKIIVTIKLKYYKIIPETINIMGKVQRAGRFFCLSDMMRSGFYEEKRCSEGGL